MRLHGHEAVPALLVRKIECLGKLLSRDATGAPIAHLAATHEGIQRFKGFFKRSSKIPTVNLVQVDVVGAEALQRVVDGPHDVFFVDAHIVRVWSDLAATFRRQNDF